MLCFDKPFTIEAGEEAIWGRLVLKGQLRLLSPLIIGGGSSLYGDSDIIILKDKEGNPYIPSSSLNGALKHRFNEYHYKGTEDGYKQNKLWFWGGEYKLRLENGEHDRRSCQSSMIITDLVLSEGNKAHITVRDGIKINRKSGITEEGAKFDFEIVEPGISFDFQMEVVIRKVFNRELFHSFFTWIAYQLSESNVAIGARTSQGFGRCRLENITSYMFDYRNKSDIIAWLSGQWDGTKSVQMDYSKIKDLFSYKHKQFKIKAYFRVKNSLIIGSYSGNPEAPDKVHIKSLHGSEKIAVVPGTSLRGALRSRAERIINTLGRDGTEVLKGLFGWVQDDKGKIDSSSKAFKSRIRIEEKPITINTFVEEIQHRIKINRFTGGVINNALFDSMPIWALQDNESMITLELSIDNYKEWEAGLMLLVLKDLWNGDLAIGGEKSIGRGILAGQRAFIDLDGQHIIMEQKNDQLLLYKENSASGWDEEIAEKLEGLAKAVIDPDCEANTENEVIHDAK